MIKKRTIVRAYNGTAKLASRIAPALAARWLERRFLSPHRWPTPPREADWLADAQRSAVWLADGRRVPLFIWGVGPTVLLVHGWSGRGSQLGAFAAPLVRCGFRVVAFDAPAHGQADGRLTGLPEIAETIARLGDQLGPLHAVIAHSLGAAATTVAVARGVAVARLVYIAPPDNPGDYLNQAARAFGFSAAVVRRAQTRIEKRFSFRFDHGRGSALAPRMTVPLLVVHDANDKQVPRAEGALLAQRWPGARLITTHGLGHHRILRHAQVIDAAADFVGAATTVPAAVYAR